MKRIVLFAALAPMILLSAQAEAAPVHQPQPPVSQQHHMAPPKQAPAKWRVGQKFDKWRQYKSVKDYRKYGLERPRKGQQWISVGKDFLLISVGSGLIAGVMAGR